MNLTPTIIPKSDQLNADDLITGPISIKITAVKAGTDPQQPVSIHYEGDNGKPYKPCKSMRRVMVAAWGADGANFVGRSATIFLDPSVVFGGIQVGGIRISHLSHIDKPITMALTVSKAARKPYTVQPLVVASLPELTPESDKWDAAVQAVKSGKTTVEAIRVKYYLSDDNAVKIQ